MKKTSKARFWSTCIHEASHAVMGAYLQIRIGRVWVSPKTGEGRCYFFLNADKIQRVAILLAGSIGEQLWSKRKRRHITKDDFEDIRRLKISESSMALLHPRVKEVIRAHRGAVMYLAKALSVSNLLSGEEVRKVLNLRKKYWR